MAENFKTPGFVLVLLFRDNKKETLLQKRKNTGYMDGFWDAAAGGHVEKNESVRAAAIKEAKEEICISVAESDMKFAAVYHDYFENGITYFNFYFEASNYDGKPEIGDKQKLEDLRWFPVEELPENIIIQRKIAIENYLNGKYYGQIGWS
jgi:8-oxo-dGTP pyrophosphatase MutT (NUDIX family)